MGLKLFASHCPYLLFAFYYFNIITVSKVWLRLLHESCVMWNVQCYISFVMKDISCANCQNASTILHKLNWHATYESLFTILDINEATLIRYDKKEIPYVWGYRLWLFVPNLIHMAMLKISLDNTIQYFLTSAIRNEYIAFTYDNINPAWSSG